MAIFFGNQKKWMWKGIGWFIGALGMLFTIYLDAYFNGSIRPAVLVIQLLTVAISSYQGIHHMTKHEKAYVKANADHLSIYRSSWTPREKVRYDEVEGFYTVSTLLVLQLKNDRESQFDL